MPADHEKRKKKVTRLKNVDVTHVSLVDRPANRTPFKFIKRDDGAEPEGEPHMHVHLKHLFGGRPAVVTSVIAKSEAAATLSAQLLMPDAESLKITKNDGLFIATDPKVPTTGDELVMHAGNKVGVAYTVANVRKTLALYDVESEDFDQTIKQEGFVPGLMVGLDALHSTIRNIAMAEDTNSPDVFKSKVAKAIESFATYIDGLVSELPQSVFKFEKALVTIAPSAAGIAPALEGFNAELYDAIFGPVAQAPAGEQAASATETPAEGGADAGADAGTAGGDAAAEASADGATGTAEGEAGGGEAVEAVGEADDGPAPANLQELPKDAAPAVDLEAAVREAMESLSKSVGDMLKPLAEKVDAVATRLDKNDAALSKVTKSLGSVASDPEDDDDSKVVAIRRSEQGVDDGGSEPPYIDTAYMKRG